MVHWNNELVYNRYSSAVLVFSTYFCPVKVWPLGERRRQPNPELWASAVPHTAAHRVAPLERLPCDGHGGDEAGRERHPQLLPDWPGQAQPVHSGFAAFHPLQNVPRGQPHHPWDPGERTAPRWLRSITSHCFYSQFQIPLISDCFWMTAVFSLRNDPSITGCSFDYVIFVSQRLVLLISHRVWSAFQAAFWVFMEEYLPKYKAINCLPAAQINMFSLWPVQRNPSLRNVTAAFAFSVGTASICARF